MTMNPRKKQNLRQKFNFRAYQSLDWMRFAALPIALFSFVLSLATAITGSVETHDAALLWFSNYDTFTFQSNLMVSLFVWISFFAPDLKIFRTHDTMLALMVYIFVTFLFFNSYDLLRRVGEIRHTGIIIDDNPHKIKSVQHLYWTCSLWNHVLNPATFVAMGAAAISKENKPCDRNGYRFVSLGLVFPLIYLVYLILIPWSGYLDDGTNSYSVYGLATQTKYNPHTWLWALPLASVFPLSLGLVWNFKTRWLKTRFAALPKTEK